MDKILVFDIWADYAHFRRFYTTTSPLTFPIPPRTALCGLIGAIVGLDKEDNIYLQYFKYDKAYIGLRILSPVKKVIIAGNLINTKNAKGIGMNLIIERSQIRFEYLKEPKYRLYFYHTDKDLYNRMKNNLEYHKSVYTPCLGLSENIANFKFIGEFEIKTINPEEKYVEIHSVIPYEKIVEKEGIDFDLNSEYFSVRIPAEMNTERVVEKYSDILFERNGKPIKVKLKQQYLIVNCEEEENIVFI